jgi:polyhydroxyalkanoate synthase subunit PhaC
MTTEGNRTSAPGVRAAAYGALDVMLTDAASADQGARRFIDARSLTRLGIGLARHPGRAAQRIGELGTEVVKVAAGSSEVSAPKSDRRFSDKAWQGNWALRRLMQGYLALEQTADGLIDDAELDFAADRLARFAVENLLDAVAPTNFPLTNPAVLKETIDRGGANLAIGGRRFVRDVSKGRLPALVDPSKFEVGGNLALSPGSIVLRTEVFELIQYAPQSEQVYEIPLLIIPPMINKYYILDIAPGRSLAEYMLQQGFQVFMISWRNPDSEHGHFDFDAYARSILEAKTAAAEVVGQDSAHLMAACSGGIVAAGAAAHLAASGRLSEVATLTLMVCAIDSEQAGTTAALTSRETAAAAIAKSARKGYLEGEALASVFAWLRPNDLIWSSVINNYLLGRELPAFDILYWNGDTVRLSAGLHRDFVMLSLENSMTRPGEFTVLGTPIDLHQVELDSYIIAGSNDHIVPWSNAYSTTQLLGGTPRFILSSSGHIQALVNPPSPESRSSFRVADRHPAKVSEWESIAATKRGSWWPDYVEWLSQRSGERRDAAPALGNDRYVAQGKAPGNYVLAS